MTAATIPNLDEAIQSAYVYRAHTGVTSPHVHIEDGIGEWMWNLTDAMWDRWACSGDECPGRPEWDSALSEQSWEAVKAYRAEVLALVRQRMTEFAVTFQREHPGAVLREVKPSE